MKSCHILWKIWTGEIFRIHCNMFLFPNSDFLQKIENETVYSFPYIRGKSYRFGIALPVFIVKVVRVYLVVENKYRLWKDILPETLSVMGEYLSVDSESDETNMPQYEFISLLFMSLLRPGYKVSFFREWYSLEFRQVSMERFTHSLYRLPV